MRLRGIAVVWGVLAVAAAAGLFRLKYEVIALEERLATLTHAIEADRRAIHVLRAEWSYFNDPDSLDKRVGAKLDLVPMDPAHIIALDALPFRPKPVGETAGGPARPPRVLNPGSAAPIPVPGQKPATLAEYTVMRTQP
ncbi:hypothetical protein F1188_15245 [Roseospira marina]|uniref:Cell division protein FtsL n=1 Tax=Roseospira marina TaxID=140057 RepID=A0A5M6IA60_9PROT|nr:hypothetical protein [Roseospira marina]KAA5604568.1 hypothetical protein F1188_15245 [Roseospira marina]MBB4315315.1 hypothetical protein [Roseospira marina]MBB5088314.1 hypothetical protein [Roseospira marina]